MGGCNRIPAKVLQLFIYTFQSHYWLVGLIDGGSSGRLSLFHRSLRQSRFSHRSIKKTEKKKDCHAIKF
jgi:hypothetical protein